MRTTFGAPPLGPATASQISLPLPRCSHGSGAREHARTRDAAVAGTSQAVAVLRVVAREEVGVRQVVDQFEAQRRQFLRERSGIEAAEERFSEGSHLAPQALKAFVCLARVGPEPKRPWSERISA